MARVAWLLLSSAVLACVARASVGWADCKEHFLDGTTPTTILDSVGVCRDGYYAISYDPAMQNPSWTAYHISRTDTRANIPGRVSSFHKDPDLTALGITTPSNDNPVFSSDWNRGHLAPSQIMSYTEDAKFQTYTTSNIAPQWWQFNQQSWQKQESYIFDWINESSSASTQLYIVTGVGYANRNKVEKTDGVATPSFYFTAICDAAAGESVAFLGENEQNAGGLLQTYRKVDDVAATVFCGVSINSPTAGPDNSFRIFPDRCNTDKVNAKHWKFPGYATTAGGANCSLRGRLLSAQAPQTSADAPHGASLSTSIIIAGCIAGLVVLSLTVLALVIRARRKAQRAGLDEAALSGDTEALRTPVSSHHYGGVELAAEEKVVPVF